MNRDGQPRTLRGDFEWLEQSWRNGELVHRLRDVVDEKPTLALGAAVAVGFVLGGLPRGALTVLLGYGTRMAGAWLQREFLERADAQERHS